MVKPHDIVTLNSMESKNDNEIVQFQWMQVSGSPTAVIEVCDLSLTLMHTFQV